MATHIKFVSDISHADENMFGRESVLLSDFKRAGLPVSNAFVVSSAARLEFNKRKNFSEELKEEIEAAYSVLGFEPASTKSVADILSKSPDILVSVRPASAPYARKPNIAGLTNILQAIREIWPKHKSQVIVQRQITPEKSGTAKIDGGKLKIDAAWGFYTGRVDGNSMVAADEFGRLIRKNIPDKLKASQLISDAEHELIGRLASKSESVAGQPVSITWCSAGNAVYLEGASTGAEIRDYSAGFSFLENGPAKQGLIDNLLNVFDGLNLNKPKAAQKQDGTSYLEIFFNKIVAPLASKFQAGGEDRKPKTEDIASIYSEVCATNIQPIITSTKSAGAENAILDLSELSRNENLSEYEHLIFEKASSMKSPWIKISNPLDRELSEIFSAEIRALKRLSEKDSDFGLLVSGMATINGFKRAKEILQQNSLQASRVGIEFDGMNAVMISDVLCRLSDFATANTEKLGRHLSGRPLLRALQDIHRSAKVAGIPFSLILHSPDKSLTEFLIRDGFETIAVPEKISDLVKVHILAAEKKILLDKKR